ncbi:MAG TPA: Clp1/GlmU family protein [Armatimonadota bacterium]|nr:Clp1/GlmU family protein [Armatimonadota bacterium]
MMLQLPDDWKPHLDDILSSPGVTVVVGAVDTGKTSLCALLANRALASGIPAAVVDGDVGQSEIGPPTTVGLGLVESEIRNLNELEPRSLYFVGSTSPVGHLLASVTGVKSLVERAQSLGKQLVIVDTTGLVRGSIGRRLKTHKIELLRARHVVALQKAGEAEHFLRFFDTWEDCTVHRLSIAPGVRPKSQLLRMQRRAVRFREYFQDGRMHTLPLEKLATTGTWLRTGDPLEPKYLKFAESALRASILYGEVIDRAVYLVAGAAPARERGIEELQERFGTKNVIIVPASKYVNLAVGLVDSRLELLALGVVRGIDFQARSISVFTPLRSAAPVCSIRFGVLKLRPDGSEIGRLRPGEL